MRQKDLRTTPLFRFSLLTATLVLASMLSAAESPDLPTIDGDFATAILVDARSGMPLAAKNPDQRRQPASMLKMMTELILLEHIDEDDIAMTDTVTVSARASRMGGSQVYLAHREQFTVEELMGALAIHSANDAAVALAEHTAGSVEAFVDLMNLRALELGMVNSEFHTVHGLPAGRGQQPDMTTARDMAILGRELLKHPEALVWSSQATAPFRGGKFTLYNPNKLVGKYRGLDGLKTGYHGQAGFCVTATAIQKDVRLLSVVMGCPTNQGRATETTRLLSYGFNRYRKVTVVSEAGVPVEAPVALEGPWSTRVLSRWPCPRIARVTWNCAMRSRCPWPRPWPRVKRSAKPWRHWTVSSSAAWTCWPPRPWKKATGSIACSTDVRGRPMARREFSISGGRILAVALVWVTLLCLVACQPRTGISVEYPEAVSYAADRDSVSLTVFLTLPETERQARTSEAAVWRRHFDETDALAGRLQALRTAVGLDPTDAGSWLRLAQYTRWFGDYTQVEDALQGLRSALPHRSTGRALHLAGRGRHRRAEDIAYRFADRDHRAHWIYGVSYWRRGGTQPAHGIFTGSDSAISSGSNDFVKGVMRPVTVRAAECYRDFGTVEELEQNWWLAEQQYEFSAGFVPGLDEAGVIRIDRVPLGRMSADNSMPVWLAFDLYFITGSLSSYLGLAFDRFETAETPATREFWAAAVLDAAGSLVRLDYDEAWAQRARGLVLAEFEGRQGQAQVDLEAAMKWFDSRRIDEIRTMTTLANLYLRRNRPARARPLLERVTEVDPRNARAWSDLGLAYVQLGEIEPALSALRRAIELDEELAVAWYNRGLMRYHLEDVPGAVADLERAHELAPQDPDIEALLKQLRRRLEQP